MHYYEGGRFEATKFDTAATEDQFKIFKNVEAAIAHQREVIDGYRDDSRVGPVLDEWSVWDQIPEADEKRYGKLWQQSTMRSGVAAGLGLNMFNLLANKLYMCNIAQVTNVLQSLLITDGPEKNAACLPPLTTLFCSSRSTAATFPGTPKVIMTLL